MEETKEERRARIALGRRIRQIRMFKEMKQEELGQVLGDMSISSVSAYEKGGLPVPRHVLESVAHLVGLEVEDIETGSKRFEELIRSKADLLERKRIRSSSDRYHGYMAPDIDMLINRMRHFEGVFSKITDRMIENRDALASNPLTPTEMDLLEGFRKLPHNRQRRLLEDINEWLNAYNMSNKNLR